MLCHGCGSAVQVTEKVFRGDLCPKCARPLHCCKNCGFFDLSAYHECHENQAEWVRDKEAANYCEYFRPREGGQFMGGKDGSGQARRKVEDLFRKP